jgi:hypothetical protein
VFVKFSLESEQLSKEDIRNLLQAIRDCEQKNFPKKKLFISLVTPELNVEECKELLGSIRPPYGLGHVTFEFGKK